MAGDKAGDDKADDSGPDIVELKRMLARARSKPIQAAAGQGNSKAGGLVKLTLNRRAPGLDRGACARC